MPPMPAGAQRHGPSWVDKLKMGALMGGTVGSIMGFIYGTVTIFQYGAGTAGVMRTLGKYMAGSGGMFAVFMGVGSIIRSDADQRALQMWRAQYRTPIIHPRSDMLRSRR
ncbi:subunit of TIM23 translocase complex [Neophaeococcomyces mojaviensis]|uniref:Subunit of TIM23 translocase complex n=1 Tax=Neophaeococcomyces mojaviensis TaxID=3383035 RepID=A0ACC3A525_9EURO|nr:subunit of TIM23 translocase complex [Knufia sp. JES_112]